MKKTNLRRLLAAVLCLVMVLSLFTACSKGSSKSSKSSESSESSESSNTYKTPLDNMMEQANAKTLNAYNKAQEASITLFKKERMAIKEIEEKAEDYDTQQDSLDDMIREAVEEYEEEYGENYKFYYEIDDKDEIRKVILTDSKKSLKNYAKQQEEYYKDLKGDDNQVEILAENAGLKKGQMEDIIDLKIDIFKKLQKVEITEGYELDVTSFVQGSELDEPEEEGDETIKVYKIDGKWVIWNDYYDGFAEIEDDATEPDEY